MIGDRDVAAYREHGYLIVPAVLDRDEVGEVRHLGSIYENQTAAPRRFFPVTDEPAAAPRT